MIHIERRARDGIAHCGAAMGPDGWMALVALFDADEGSCPECRRRELRLRQEEDARLAGPEAVRMTRAGVARAPGLGWDD